MPSRIRLGACPLAKAVSWENSPIDALRESIITILRSGTGYSIKDAIKVPQSRTVYVLPDGWSPPFTGCAVLYRTRILCLYGTQDESTAELSAEEMARRCFSSLALAPSPPSFEDVPAPETLVFPRGEDQPPLVMAAVQFVIKTPLELVELEQED